MAVTPFLPTRGVTVPLTATGRLAAAAQKMAALRGCRMRRRHPRREPDSAPATTAFGRTKRRSEMTTGSGEVDVMENVRACAPDRGPPRPGNLALAAAQLLKREIRFKNLLVNHALVCLALFPASNFSHEVKIFEWKCSR